MRRSALTFALLTALTGCSDMMSNPVALGGLGGSSGRPGTVNPTQVLSMGQDLYKAATLSDEDVQKMAREAVAEMDKANRIAGANDPYTKRLNKLASNLRSEDGLTLNYKVYLTKDVNAFSMADGSIRVFSALMDRMSDDELRFILGHEIGHIKNGHRKERMKRAYAANAAVKAANTGIKATTSSNIGGVAAVIGGDMAMKLAAEVIKGQFSQSDETESDEYGLNLLAKYQHPKDASVTALMKLGDLSGGADNKSDLFTSLTSSHPDPVSRAKHMQSLIPELAGKTDLTKQPVQVAKNDASAGASNSDKNAAALQPVKENRAQAQLPADSEAVPTSEGDSEEPQLALHNQAPTQAIENHDSDSVRPGWYIQVGAFSNRDSALKLKQGLSRSGKAVALHDAVVSGQSVYRVIVGPFDSRVSAERRLPSVRASKHKTSDAFVRQIEM